MGTTFSNLENHILNCICSRDKNLCIDNVNNIENIDNNSIKLENTMNLKKDKYYNDYEII